MPVGNRRSNPWPALDIARSKVGSEQTSGRRYLRRKATKSEEMGGRKKEPRTFPEGSFYRGSSEKTQDLAEV